MPGGTTHTVTIAAGETVTPVLRVRPWTEGSGHWVCVCASVPTATVPLLSSLLVVAQRVDD